MKEEDDTHDNNRKQKEKEDEDLAGQNVRWNKTDEINESKNLSGEQSKLECLKCFQKYATKVVTVTKSPIPIALKMKTKIFQPEVKIIKI